MINDKLNDQILSFQMFVDPMTWLSQRVSVPQVTTGLLGAPHDISLQTCLKCTEVKGQSEVKGSTEGYVSAMSATGPCPDTRTHLSWKLFNICKGLWERTTCSGTIYRERERGHRLCWSNHSAWRQMDQSHRTTSTCPLPVCLSSTCLSYLDIQQMRQLLGLVMSLTTSCIGDKYNRKQEVLVLVQKLPESSLSSRDHWAATEQNAVHVKEDTSLPETDRWDRDRSTLKFKVIVTTSNRFNNLF